MASSPDVIVIGAGALGLCTAAELAGRGHAVTVIDPGGVNASSIAAGMLAPALESLLDDLSPEQAALLKRARDLWPAFAEAHGLVVHREGAEWRGPDAAAAVARLNSLGFEARATGDGLTTADDWRIEPATALAALTRTAGVTLVRARIARLSGDARRWRVEADDGRTWFAPTVALATGVAAAIPGLPDRIAALVDSIQPIRGQLTQIAVDPPRRVVRAPGLYVAPTTGGAVIGATMEPGRRDLDPDRIAALVDSIQPIRGQLTQIATDPPRRVVRAPGLYVAPTTGGAVIGATMEPGRRDLDPDPVEARARVEAGLALLGQPGEVGQTRVGIRGAVADGLPLAGPSGEPGLHLALAPRRNGWLLGPLVAAIVADGVEGRSPAPDAAALDPLRFSPPAAD